MSITSIIILIGVLLIASVVGSIIFTKKEQAANLRRQKVAGYRYKADEAQDLFDGLQNAGLEKNAYQFLLERVVSNLQAAYDVDHGATGIKSRLSRAKSTLASLDEMTFYIQMPSAMSELHGLVGRLNKLVKYLVILFQKRMIPEHQYTQIMPALQRTLLKFDAEGHIKMGHQAANDGQPGTAKQCYLHAKQKLIDFGAEDSYVTTQLEKVEELIVSLEQENVIPGGVNLHESAAKEAEEEAAKIAEHHEQTKEEQEAKTAQEALNKQSESTGDFTPKKKW